MFFFQKARPMYLLAALLWVLVMLKRVFIFPDALLEQLDQGLLFLLGVFYLLFIVALAATLFQYIAYEFMLDEHALKIRSGIINLQIEAIPYRQMQNVDIERDLLYRILGVSRMVILTAGTEDASTGNESEGIIPAIDKNLAFAIQRELLKRANEERVVAVQQPSPTVG